MVDFSSSQHALTGVDVDTGAPVRMATRGAILRSEIDVGLLAGKFNEPLSTDFTSAAIVAGLDVTMLAHDAATDVILKHDGSGGTAAANWIPADFDDIYGGSGHLVAFETRADAEAGQGVTADTGIIAIGGLQFAPLPAAHAAPALVSGGRNWGPAEKVFVEHFKAAADIDDTESFERAIAYGAAERGAEIHLGFQDDYSIRRVINVGDGGDGAAASSYHNIYIVGRGHAPEYSIFGATEIIYTGPAQDAHMFKFEGPSGAMGLRGCYLNCNALLAGGLRVRSVKGGEFRDLLIQNFTGIGADFTTVSNAQNGNSYTRNNDIGPIECNSNIEGSQGFGFDGNVDNGFNNDCHNNRIKGLRAGVPRTLDANVPWPCGIVLGYCDSNTFIECDFQLNSQPVAGVFDDIDALRQANVASIPDGTIYTVRYFGNVNDPLYGGRQIRNERRCIYDASSTDADNSATTERVVGDNGITVVQPASGPGRFRFYRGSALALDATKRDRFPLANGFEACALIEGPSIADITSNTNMPEANVFNRFPTKDAEEIPMLQGVIGTTDNGSGFAFGGIPETRERTFFVDGGSIGVGQSNRQRRFKIRPNFFSGSVHAGTIFGHDSRGIDSDPWSETGSFVMTEFGDIVPRADATQNLGEVGNPWHRVNARTLFPEEHASAPTGLINGELLNVNGGSFDPTGLGRRHLAINEADKIRAVVTGDNKYTAIQMAANETVSVTPPDPEGEIIAKLNNSFTRAVRALYQVGSSPNIDFGQTGSVTTIGGGAMTGSANDGQLECRAQADGTIQIRNGATASRTLYLRLNGFPGSV